MSGPVKILSVVIFATIDGWAQGVGGVPVAESSAYSAARPRHPQISAQFCDRHHRLHGHVDCCQPRPRDYDRRPIEHRRDASRDRK